MEEKNRLLFIDDEEIILDSCTQILAKSDLVVATAINGESGLKLLEEFKPDMVFVDLKMPGISGFEVVEKIHQSDPTIVTVVITGFATVSSAVEAMKQGAFDFLPKPFTPDELRLITRRGLEKRKLVLETMALRREREMMREHFAAIVSHELKSPLSAVQQNLFILGEELSENLNPQQRNLLSRCQIRINDLMQLIHTWLRVITRDIGEIQKNFQPIEVNSTIKKAIDSVAIQATRKDIEIRFILREPSSMIYGDEGTLVESLVNIIGNAIKYSRVSSHVTVNEERKNDQVLISVSDNGVGIAKEDLPFLFNDFYIGKSAPEDAKGSGLGLALTRRIIEAHHGAISIESEPGRGSTFTIQLPAYLETIELQSINEVNLN